MEGIVLDRVSQRYGAVTALSDVSIEIPAGEFLVLLGPSGCGKSTLLRVIAGPLAPTSGRVVIDGADVTALAPGARDIAMVFQSYALYPHVSVRRNLGFGLRVRHRPGAEVRAKADAVAAQLQLTELLDRKPRELPGGQRQRVAAGRAMVADPRAFSCTSTGSPASTSASPRPPPSASSPPSASWRWAAPGCSTASASTTTEKGLP
jgi:multiple sugar transport system ATP-binding protein